MKLANAIVNTLLKEAKKDERLSKQDIIKANKKKNISQVRQAQGKSNAGKYTHVAKKNFAGPSGTFPINDIKHAKAALAYAHNAKDPRAIRDAVYSKYPSLKKEASLQQISALYKQAYEQNDPYDPFKSKVYKRNKRLTNNLKKKKPAKSTAAKAAAIAAQAGVPEQTKQVASK